MYEEVDEQQYSKMVRERQEDDWIIDDGKFYSVGSSQKICLSESQIQMLPLSFRWDWICGGRQRNL